MKSLLTLASAALLLSSCGFVNQLGNRESSNVPVLERLRAGNKVKFITPCPHKIKG